MGIRHAIEGDREGWREIEGGVETEVVGVGGAEEGKGVEGVVGELSEAEGGGGVNSWEMHDRMDRVGRGLRFEIENGEGGVGATREKPGKGEFSG